MIDANQGAGYTVKTLIRMKDEHERNQGNREKLQAVLHAYLGDRYSAENSVQFQQVDLRGPSVDAMFVDVPVGYRRDSSTLTDLLEEIAKTAPGDTNELERSSGLVITGATQALLNPGWFGNALLVGGPGQGKSTLLQYICQFHRARRLGESGYTAGFPTSVQQATTTRFPVRIDLRRYAQWATSSPHKQGKSKKAKDKFPNASDLRSIEVYLIEQINNHVGAHEFTANDFALLLATEPVLLALDGLDEVASLSAREQVIEEIARMRGRLRLDAADLVILVTTRPGTSLQPLTSSGAFPILHLQRLTQGLRLQYLDQWCDVSNLSAEAVGKLRSTFMDSQHVPHINELASYPMQLAILLHLLHRRQLLPQQRTDLYEEYLKTFLDREQGENKEPLLAEKRRLIEDTHAYLGWYLQTKAEEGQSAGSIGREELRELLHGYLAGRPRAQELAEELYSAFTDRVLCLVERNDSFEFEVQSLREYFAAIHIFDNLTPKGSGNSRDDGLNALLERPYWSNVCRFFIGKLARGEIRALIGNFKFVDKKVAPLPLVRAMAATVLNDRIYDELTSAEISDVVNFVLDGPGVFLAEDGELDPAGSPLLLTQEAGRLQAVAHLKQRLITEPSLSAQVIIASSLAAHSNVHDDISNWWWEKFEPEPGWLEIAASLEAFRDLSPDRTRLLAEALTNAAMPVWTSTLLQLGGYDGHCDALARVMLSSLNDGGAENVNAHIVERDLGDLDYLASDALAGLYETTKRIYLGDRPKHSQTTARIDQISRSYRDGVSGSASASDSERFLGAIADAWGSGWVLRRAVAMMPRTVNLAVIANHTTRAPLDVAARSELDYRANRSDAAWWSRRLASVAGQYDLMVHVLALLENAKSSTIINVASDLEDAVSKLEPKRYRAIERALHQDRSVGQVRLLDIQEALRLHQVSFSGRVLWLLWCISTDSTRERISVQLESELGDLFRAGTADGRLAVLAVKARKKIKLDAFRGSRASLPIGGWADQTRLATMTPKVARSVLLEPTEWPVDIIEIAIDKLGAPVTTQMLPLAKIAKRDNWFRL